MLQRRYQTMGFRVDDPWERELPDRGPIAAYDPASGRLVTLDGGRPTGRPMPSGARGATRLGGALSRPLSRLVVSAADDRFDALVRFFHARMRAGGSRGSW